MKTVQLSRGVLAFVCIGSFAIIDFLAIELLAWTVRSGLSPSFTGFRRECALGFRFGHDLIWFPLFLLLTGLAFVFPARRLRLLRDCYIWPFCAVFTSLRFVAAYSLWYSVELVWPLFQWFETPNLWPPFGPLGNLEVVTLEATLLAGCLWVFAPAAEANETCHRILFRCALACAWIPAAATFLVGGMLRLLYRGNTNYWFNSFLFLLGLGIAGAVVGLLRASPWAQGVLRWCAYFTLGAAIAVLVWATTESLSARLFLTLPLLVLAAVSLAILRSGAVDISIAPLRRSFPKSRHTSGDRVVGEHPAPAEGDEFLTDVIDPSQKM